LIFQLVYCGHEYSIQNLSFGLSVEPDNDVIKNKLEWSKAMRAKDPPEPTVPSTIGKFFGGRAGMFSYCLRSILIFLLRKTRASLNFDLCMSAQIPVMLHVVL
jgi:hypothetical protein